MDRVTPEVRSRIMSGIRSSRTRPELAVKPILEHFGFEYQKKVEGLTVDFANRRHRIAIFIDGCFWHGCPRHYREPKTNTEFWGAKLERNRARDTEQRRRLGSAGWVVLRFWGCELSKVAGLFGYSCQKDKRGALWNWRRLKGSPKRW